MLGERRNTTFEGHKRRKEFDRSIQTLQALGMPAWAVDFYRRTARVAGLLPHEILRHIGITAAGHVLQNPEIAVFPTMYDAAQAADGNNPRRRRAATPRKRRAS
jgi:hypothetical protein